jgi:hypothetical protein
VTVKKERCCNPEKDGKIKIEWKTPLPIIHLYKKFKNNISSSSGGHCFWVLNPQEEAKHIIHAS